MLISQNCPRKRVAGSLAIITRNGWAKKTPAPKRGVVPGDLLAQCLPGEAGTGITSAVRRGSSKRRPFGAGSGGLFA